MVLEEREQHAVDAAAVELGDVLRDLFGGPEEGQPAPSEREHLEREAIEGAAVAEEAARPVLRRLAVHLIQEAAPLLLGLPLRLTPDHEWIGRAADRAAVFRSPGADVRRLVSRRVDRRQADEGPVAEARHDLLGICGDACVRYRRMRLTDG